MPDVARAAQKFQQWVLALFDRYGGLAATSCCRPGQRVLEWLFWYDSFMFCE
jgi:hypothetical protein